MVKSYKELVVWQKSIKLVGEIYSLTNCFPDVEKYGLSNQMRRCAVSIPSNIAEGFYRKTKKDFLRFILIAFGSGAELETQIIIAKDLKYGSTEKYLNIEGLLEEIMKMLNKLSGVLKISEK